jgi:hypothetical protein
MTNFGFFYTNSTISYLISAKLRNDFVAKWEQMNVAIQNGKKVDNLL